MIISCSLIGNISCTELVSPYLDSVRVTEGDSFVLNCTVTGRENPNERISWFIDWTPDNKVPGKRFFAEETRTVTDDNEIPSDHGTYSFEYTRTEMGLNATDVHTCLLRVSQVTFADVGDYWCAYYSDQFGNYVNLGDRATVFVLPSDGGRPPIQRSTAPTTPHASTFPAGGGSSGTSAAIVSVTVILFVIITVLVSIWAVYRYRRYRRDKNAKKIQMPTELPKVESQLNSYGGVTVNGSVQNENNTENIIITDDEPNVRVPPGMEANNEPPSYSSLNRPDSEIRNQLGEPTYNVPPDAEVNNTNYVITIPSGSASHQQDDNTYGALNRDRTSSTNSTSYEITAFGSAPEEPSVPSRSSSQGNPRHSVTITPSSKQDYEIVSPDFNPPAPARSTSRTPNDSVYMRPASLAYEDDAGRTYEDVPNPDTQL